MIGYLVTAQHRLLRLQSLLQEFDNEFFNAVDFGSRLPHFFRVELSLRLHRSQYLPHFVTLSNPPR